MSTPALIYICLTGFGLGVAVSKHGLPKTGNHDIGESLFATAIVYTLLYWGGFFS